jgi:hypothetical protein
MILLYQVSSIRYSYLIWGTFPLARGYYKWHPEKKERKGKTQQKQGGTTKIPKIGKFGQKMQ